MKRHTKTRLFCWFLAMLVLLVAGCFPDPVSFALGWLSHDLLTVPTVEYECYRDGVQVDCSTLDNFVP